MTTTDPPLPSRRPAQPDGAEFGSVPIWPVMLDRHGNRPEHADAALGDAIDERRTTDLLVLAHGWNDEGGASFSLYQRFVSECELLLQTFGTASERVVGCAGIRWPSARWPEGDPEDEDGGASGSGIGHAAIPATLEGIAAGLFDTKEERAELQGLLHLLDEQPASEQALGEFIIGVRALALDEVGEDRSSMATPLPDEDALEGDVLFADDWRELLERLALQEESAADEGGAAAGNVFGRLWRGARGALRTLSYWTMKRRAGIVGQDGLGPLISALARRRPGLRIHLIGHSFGARLVSYALKGLPDTAVGPQSPVKSLVLLQGAFSHFAFADTLPHDPRRGGHLRGMGERVDGPLLATHSRHDSAVRYAYPLASLIARQDASAVPDPTSRWGAMGDDGAQSVNALSLTLSEAGTDYPFQPGQWFNLNGDDVIRRGPPPSGAHGDVVHPHTAWAALAAAGIITTELAAGR